MTDTGKARLLDRGEIGSFIGAAWLEVWYEAEEDEPEYKEIMQVGACMGNLVDAGGNITDCRWLAQQYNKPYGMRLWINGQPTEAQREAAPWAG